MISKNATSLMDATRRFVETLVIVAFATSASAQIPDQLVLGARGSGATIQNAYLVRFDRKLQLLGTTDLSPIGMIGFEEDERHPLALCPNGDYWISIACGGSCKSVARLDPLGTPKFVVLVSAFPLVLAADRQGNAFVAQSGTSGVFTSIRKLDSTGATLWDSPASTASFVNGWPSDMCITPDGFLWFASRYFPPGAGFHEGSRFRKIDPATGAVVLTYDEVWPQALFGTPFRRLVATPNNSVWTVTGAITAQYPQPNGVGRFRDSNGVLTRHLFHYSSGGGGFDVGKVDAKGRYSLFLDVPFENTRLSVFNSTSGAIEASWDIGWAPIGWAYGPTGEEVYAVVADNNPPTYTRWLVKLNVVTGQQSRVLLSPQFTQPQFFETASTGFVYANTVDRGGDSDGDGYANGVEVAAGMNPFDPLSRPGGPKSYLWFDAAAENALKIRFVDSDGILDPVGGLDLTTLSLWAEHPLWGSGEIFWDAAALLTAIDFSTDGTEVTLTYGNMKLTKGLGFGFTASVRDLTGALGWDWHLTPQ